MKKPSPASRKGRPPSEMAASHAAIIDAVYALLQEKVDQAVRRGVGRASHPRAPPGKWPELIDILDRMAPPVVK
jgi:hypothetical protein